MMFETMGVRTNCETILDVVRLRQREEGTNFIPIIMEFRSECDK